MKSVSRKILIVSLLFFTILSCQKDNDESERSYTKSVERIFTNDFEENLIYKAEKHYPPRDSVLKVAKSFMEIPESKYWYYNSFDGINIPYTITEDAVNYYSGLIDEFNKNKKINMFLTADFQYVAEVTFEKNFTSPAFNSIGENIEFQEFSSVYVVALQLKWEDYCGNLCAMWINKKRIVVFNETGELLAVFLDGEEAVAVS